MRKLHKISANGNPDFVIRNYAQFLNARQESSRVMSILLATVAGISLREQPLFGVQYHTEASPGPHDADHHFSRFVNLIEAQRQGVAAF